MENDDLMVFRVDTPVGTAYADFTMEDEPVKWGGDDLAIRFIRSTLDVAGFTGRDGYSLEMDSIDRDSFYDFCSRPEFGLVITPPFVYLEYLAERRAPDDEGVILDSLTSLQNLVLDSVSLTGMEKIKLVRELSGIRMKISDSSTKGVEKIKLVKRISEIRVLLGGTISNESDNGNSTEDQPVNFGLEKGEGKGTREKINSQVKQLVAAIQAGKDSATLTPEELELFRKYSGKGGPEDNSQDQYYTPAFVAEGMWDLLKSNGIGAGNILEPSTGAGVFSATKPTGTRITGTEIDPVAATVNKALHPEDGIQNSPFEHLAASVEDNTYDSVIGNVPFGNRNGKTLDDDPTYKSEKMLERYFIQRAIDKCKPGGLVVLVVPPRVVEKADSGWKKFRAQVSRKAEFLGAHKLPQGTFSRQGTDTATDIVVFKKHPTDLIEKIKSLDTNTLESAKVLWGEFINGKYWQGEGKAFYHGQFVPKSETGFRDEVRRDPAMSDAALKAKLAARFDSRIDWALLGSAQAVVNAYADGDVKMINGTEHRFENGDWVKLQYKEPEEATLDAATYGAATVEKLQAMLQDPQSMLELNNTQAFKAYKKFPAAFDTHQKHAVEFAQSQVLDKHREIAYRASLTGSMVVKYTAKLPDFDETERATLIAALKAEYEKYGHPSNLKGFMLTGEMSRYFGAFIGAIDKDGNISSTITEGVSKATGYRSKDVQSIIDYLFKQGEEPISLEQFKAIYDGDRKIESVGDIADIEHIAITPDGFLLPRGKYCAGMVYEKIADLQAVMLHEKDERVKQKWQQQIEVMSKSATWTNIDDITFGMSERWISKKYVYEFLKQQGYSASYVTTVNVQKTDADTGESYLGAEFIRDDFDNPNGEWSLGARAKDSGFVKQFEHWLNGKRIGYNVKDAAGKSSEERTKDYQEQLDGLDDLFNMFMKQHEDAQDLEGKYNYAFNGYVPPDYEQDDLGLTDTSGFVKPHWYQNAGVRQISEEGRGILGFDVGLGKTFSALAFSSFDLKMGRSKKHCIVVPKSVLANWYHEARSFYKNMNHVLFVGFEPKRDKKSGKILREPVLDENGNPKINKHRNEVEYQDQLITDSADEKYRKMHLIPFTDKKLVVMTKETFNAIPMRPTTKSHYIDKMVERNMVSAAIAQKEGKSYSDDVKEAKLSQQFADDGGRKKNEYPFFEDMGFDRVIVDEAHYFKNSYGVGEDTAGLAYLPSPQSASIARGMAMKMAYLRDKNDGKGSVLLTATPVSNSPIEIYNMLTLVIPPEEFERYGVRTPDDFIKTFGIIGMVDKVGVDGLVKSREGLKGFRKLRALRGIFHRYANMKAPKDVDPEGNTLKLPKAVEVIDRVTMTDEQHKVYAQLRAEASESANPKNAGKVRAMFAVIRDMDRVTTDMDMYENKITYIFKKSEKVAVDSLIASLKDRTITIKDDESGETKKVTVKVERTYSAEGDSIVYRPSAYDADQIEALFEKFGIGYVSHPLRPKYAKLLENMQAELDRNGKQIVFTEEKTQHGKIKRLIANHLPVTIEQIAIINAETADGDKLQDIADSYNRGDFKIVIANKKAEVGVNLQKGTTAIHHLTLPWNPASIQQRNGRGVRQGNTVSDVHVYYYQATGSFDEYRLDLLKKKGNWIANLMDKQSDSDEAENSEALGAMEMAALMSSDKEEFWRRMKAQEDKRKAADLKRKHDNAKSRLHQLSAASYYVHNFDKIKADRIAEIDAEIAEATRIKDDWIAKGNQENADKKDAQIAQAEKRKERLSTVMADTLKQKKAVVAQIAGSLKAAGKRGDLPFDADIVDNPENFIVARDGKVFCTGKYYEYDRSIIKVISVDKAKRTISVQYPTNRNYESTYEVDKISKKTSDTDISAADVAWRSMVDDYTFSYGRLKEVSKSKFEEVKGGISASDYAGRAEVLHYREDGFLEFSRWVAYGSDKPVNCVYPDTDDEALKKLLIEGYRASLKRNYDKVKILPEGYGKLMPVFFGENWKEIAEEGLPVMMPQELDELLARSVHGVLEGFRRQWREENAMYAKHQDTDREELDNLQSEFRHVRAASMEGWRGSIYKESFEAARMSMEEGGYVNIGDIHPSLQRLLDSLRESISGRIDNLKASIEKRELEAIERQKEEKIAAKRKDPNFKEVSPEYVKKFSDLGLKVWINDEDVKGVAAFSSIFMLDNAGYGGILTKMKDIIKNRYKAQFMGSKQFPPRDYVNTWRVPADTSIADLYDIFS